MKCYTLYSTRDCCVNCVHFSLPHKSNSCTSEPSLCVCLSVCVFVQVGEEVASDKESPPTTSPTKGPPPSQPPLSGEAWQSADYLPCLPCKLRISKKQPADLTSTRASALSCSPTTSSSCMFICLFVCVCLQVLTRIQVLSIVSC